MCEIPAALAAKKKDSLPHRRKRARIRSPHGSGKFTGGLETEKAFTKEIAPIFLKL